MAMFLQDYVSEFRRDEILHLEPY